MFDLRIDLAAVVVATASRARVRAVAVTTKPVFDNDAGEPAAS